MNKIGMHIKEFFRLVKEYIKYWLRPLSLDIHIAEHCNLNCVSCSHYSPLAEPKFCDLGELEKNLSYLTKMQQSFGVLQLMGGEPLLYPDIVEVFRISRKCLDKTRIDLKTNGLLLKSMPDSFWEACRQYDIVISVTVYPVNVDYKEIKKLCREHGVKYEVFAVRTGKNAFFAYRVNPKGGKRVFMKFLKCYSSGCMQLVGNRIYACPMSADIQHLNKAFGYDFKQRKGDYVEVDKIRTALPIRWLRSRTKPFCHYCELRGSGFAWSQSERKPEEWVCDEH